MKHTEIKLLPCFAYVMELVIGIPMKHMEQVRDDEKSLKYRAGKPRTASVALEIIRQYGKESVVC